MVKVLLVSTSAKAADILCGLVQSVTKAALSVAKSAAEARQMLTDDPFHLVIINPPLSDENASTLARQTAKDCTCRVLYLCPKEQAEEYMPALALDGVIVVPKPVAKTGFVQAFYQGLYTRGRLAVLVDENQKLHLKIEEIKLVSRAKAVLIEYLKLSEPQAHHYIEKQAMDLRLSKTAIAQNILTTYES